ncbi:MAG: pilus assembly protein N-terminal domain-containing protein [Parvibaculum sp.]|jgi:Flp pilus assembly secretin CpaC|nr:pilus assembly protein N-terminal domain-containing protein [Parvibaculum sp.]
MPHDQTSRKPARLSVALAFGAGLAALAVTGAAASEFKVPMNETKPLHLSVPVATVIVGNPAIADVAVEGKQLLYVMGRNYGTTNLIALDADGKTIADMKLSVTAQGASAVTLTRGTGQLSYSCSPRCERVPAIGDNQDSFEALMQQAASMNEAKTGAGSGGDSSGGGAGVMR